MSHLDPKTPILSLTLPGSHNAGVYETKNFIWAVKDYVICQDLDIYQQLKAGVRVLDLRACLYQSSSHGHDNLKEPILYCSHTFLSVPYNAVLEDIKRFVHKHPSEVLVLMIRADYSPIDVRPRS